MKLNQAAFNHAKSLITAAKVVHKSDWSEEQPSADDENRFLEENDWQGFGEWFLGIDEDASENTKDRHSFPYGDFNCVHRAALIAAKQRARQYDYTEIENAVDHLLIQIDKKPDVVSEASDESFPASDPPAWTERR